MNKKTFVDLRRTIGLFNVTLFKNPRTYIIGILIPVVISAAIEFLWNRYSYLELTPPEMISFMYLSVILSSFYIGYISNEASHNSFKRKINVKINNKDIIKYTMLVLTVEMASINMFVVTILFFIVAQFNALGFKKIMFENIMGFVWFFYIVFGIFLSLVSTLIFLLIESSFNKRLYSMLLMSVALVFMIAFSDTVIPSRVISNNNAMNIIGYFNPDKYVTWSMELISSYQFQDAAGANQIYLAAGNSFEPFNELWQSTVPAIVILIALLFGYAFKKEKD